ncbi:restriction endonuclease subunit S [Paenibacillus barengoltzii]|jgi:type I restriction enzyme S subunit|uniref:restriction endonuclease subunit S n=1 Tax=Paenibacillus barengoltzii TaxID=343517 RepID=UPI003F8BC8B8
MSFENISLGKTSIEIIDGDRGKNYPKQNEFTEKGYCLFLSAKNVTTEGFEFSEKNFISAEKDSLLRKGKLQRNDIVLTTRGTVGNVAYYHNRVYYNNIRINSGMVILRVNKNEFFPDFVYWLFRSSLIQNQIKSIKTGSAQPQLPIMIMKNLTLIKPELDSQQKIASILSSLDDKIELNNRMNKVLEQMAQAIFKHWFVDFEFPNEDGDPYKSSGGEMEWCEELGKEIPKGWKFGLLSDLLIVRYGRDHKKLASGSIPVYGSGGIMRFVDKALYSSESVLIPRKGTLNNVIYVSDPFWSVDTMFFTEMKLPHIAKFIYLFLKEKDLASMNVGSAVPSMTTDILNNLGIVIPSNNILFKFDELVSLLFKQISMKQKENSVLSNIRDTLLPKLMSGEIDVSEIEL